MRALYVALVACASVISAVPARAQGGQPKHATTQDEGVLLRFQLIAATNTSTVDPAITAIDAVLKDLFRFPGYRLLSQTAVMMERPAVIRNSPNGTTMATQFLIGDGETYRLSVMIDSTTLQTVRMNVSLSAMPKPGVTTPSTTLFSTSVEVSYGHAVVLGNTQLATRTGGARGTAVQQTLILAVRAEREGAPSGNAAAVATGPEFTDAKVDVPVVVVACGAPAYPPELRAVGVSGSVHLSYVVALDGKAEASSVKIVSSTNKAFEQPAINAILSCTFTPARIKGVPVRDLIEHTVKFTPPQ